MDFGISYRKVGKLSKKLVLPIVIRTLLLLLLMSVGPFTAFHCATHPNYKKKKKEYEECLKYNLFETPKRQFLKQ